MIPYVRAVSEGLRCILTPLGVRVCFKPFRTIKQLLSHPKGCNSGLTVIRGSIYKIPCANYPASYIGQTGHRLRQHIEEYKHVVRQADSNSSALAEYAWNHSHPVDWANVRVLANPRDTVTRIVEEAVAIRKTEGAINRDNGTLTTEYNNLF